MAYTVQYVHSGSAVETYLAVDCSTASTSITLNDATGWPSPTGSQLSYGVIKPGLSGESKFTYTSRSGNILSGVVWNADGTTSSASYTSGSATVVRHTFSANEADEANATVRNTLGRVTTIGDTLYADSTTSLARLGIGTAGQIPVTNDAATAPIRVNTPPLLGWKQPVRAATTANGTLATAYANGQTIDGIALVTGDRILLKNQTTGSENGIYTVASSGAPTRATDFDTAAKCAASSIIPVQEGTTNGGTSWRLSNTGTVTPGSTAMTFAAFGGGIAASTLTAKGSLVTASASATVAELAVGTDFQLLRSRAAATNALEWATLVTSAVVTTSQTSTSTSFTDLGTVGPAATATTGATALVILTVSATNDTGNTDVRTGFAVSGATTIAANDNDALLVRIVTGGAPLQTSYAFVVTGLTPGSNVFTMKYRVGIGGTGTWAYRRIAVIPI